MTSYLKHLTVTFIVVLFVAADGSAAPGTLSDKDIERMQSSLKMDPQMRAMYNALTNTDISSLALNREIVRGHNELYSHKIEVKGITNQKSSGRCWLFAGLNVIRPKVIDKHKLKGFEFSQTYLAFWDKMEKANVTLELIIEMRDRDLMDREMEFVLRHPCDDGGYWESVVNLIEKYGAVPQGVMPETNSSSSTGLMNSLLSRKLRADAVKLREMHAAGEPLKKLRAAKKKMLAEVYRMLVLNLGEPPRQFEWRHEDPNSKPTAPKSYTPRTFYEEFVGVELGDYVNVFSDPSKEYGKHYEIRMTSNIQGGRNVRFVNVRPEVLKAAALKSVLANEPVWFACDVGKDQSREHGIMALDMYDYEAVYGVDLSMTKAQRSLYRESVPNHAMVFVGVDMKDETPVKWLVENSWGTDRGSKGYWAMYDGWFDVNVYCSVLKKDYIPDDVLKAFEQPVIQLPVWDPMWSFVN